jgi:hypothetical protein
MNILWVIIFFGLLFVILFFTIQRSQKESFMQLTMTLNPRIDIEYIERNPKTIKIFKIFDDNGIPIEIDDKLELKGNDTGTYTVISRKKTYIIISEAKIIDDSSITIINEVFRGDSTPSYISVGDNVYLKEQRKYGKIIQISNETYIGEVTGDPDDPNYFCDGDQTSLNQDACSYGCKEWVINCKFDGECNQNYKCISGKCILGSNNCIYNTDCEVNEQCNNGICNTQST